jgi:hypothetical protein
MNIKRAMKNVALAIALMIGRGGIEALALLVFFNKPELHGENGQYRTLAVAYVIASTIVTVIVIVAFVAFAIYINSLVPTK